MARVVNGTLYVPTFDTTGNPGEYTFSGATYDNQADATGNGAFDIMPGFVLFIQATDINLATPVPGIAHRYKLTVVAVIDGSTIDGTVLWDEGGSEVDMPSNGSYCIITDKTSEHLFGMPSAVGVYANLPAGLDIGAIGVDIRNTADEYDAVETLINDEGAVVVAGQIVYKSAANMFKLASAANPALGEGTVFGAVVADVIAAGERGRVVVAQGVRVKGYVGLTMNQPCFLSRTTPGAVVQNLTGFVPGNHVIKLGTPYTTIGMLFEPEYDYEY